MSFTALLSEPSPFLGIEKARFRLLRVDWLPQWSKIPEYDIRAEFDSEQTRLEIACSYRLCSQSPMGVVVVLAEDAAGASLILREVRGLYNVALRDELQMYTHPHAEAGDTIQVCSKLLVPLLRNHPFWEFLAHSVCEKVKRPDHYPLLSA